MAEYVDGFIVPVPRDKVADYKRVSRKCGKIWIEHGALMYREYLADDVKMGELTSFPRAVLQKDDETVVFAFITYKSRRDRDRINKAVMADPRLIAMGTDMPFDGKRLIFGGFKGIVEL